MRAVPDEVPLTIPGNDDVCTGAVVLTAIERWVSLLVIQTAQSEDRRSRDGVAHVLLSPPARAL